jgi:restriction endonuclease S subunit
MEQVLYSLPDGWRWQTFNDVCTNITDGAHASPKTVEEGFPYVTVRDVNHKGQIDLINCKRISEDDFLSLKKGNCLPPVDSVLLSKDGTVGKVAHVTNDYDEFVVLSSLAIIVPEQTSLSPEYLKYFLLSPEFQDHAIGSKTGAAIKRIVLRTIKNFNIPIAPLKQQKRIVEKLDALLTRIDTAIEHLQESLTLADALYASVLNDLATGVDGKTIKLGELGKIIRGSSPRPKGDPRYYGGNVPRLMVADVTRDGRYVSPQIDFLTDEGALKSRPVPKGTLTIQVSGNPGMPAILAVDACIHDGFAALIEINHESISTEYLYFSLLAVAEQNNQMAVGAIFRNLTTSQLREIEVIIPSYGKQLEMVSKMDMAEQKVKASKAELNAQLDFIFQLKASILDSAFKGEL